MTNNVVRVLWLLNAKELRKEDVAQLGALGVTEFFMPKTLPASAHTRSDDCDVSYDDTLSIPSADLDVLNAQDWYGDPSREAWDIANRHFDVAFLGNHALQLLPALKGFGGAIVLRGSGFVDRHSYSAALLRDLGEDGVYRVRAIGNRFWLGGAYEYQVNVENSYFSRRFCHLPVGYTLKPCVSYPDRHLDKILFVCPDINVSGAALAAYQKFSTDFKTFSFSIAGRQPVAVHADHMIGEVNFGAEECSSNNYKVMFYDFSTSDHDYDIPLRALQSGIVLIYMAGGMLDELSSLKTPGRANTVEEARKKIRRVLGNDHEFVEAILDAQKRMLLGFSADAVGRQWKKSWSLITTELAAIRQQNVGRPEKTRRIAVIVPVKYRGGSLRGTKMLAQALYEGSRQRGEDAEVVICHVEDKQSYPRDTFDDLGATIKIRPYVWRTLNATEARRAMRYSGQPGWEPEHSAYVVPDDGIKQLFDCDVWIVVSDRLEAPLLPVKPIIYMVYDYLQRYEPILTQGADSVFLGAARTANKILVTTNFTKFDALQYAGVRADKVAVMPMLVPEFWKASVARPQKALPYFIWTTNANQHKNHMNALKALKIYFEEYGGSLACHVTGVGTEKLLNSEMPHLQALAGLVKASPVMSRRLKFLGELSESQYLTTLVSSQFLWHAGKIDNGTFSVVEAACVGVPSLSSDYPAMHEIDTRFNLNLTWMDASDPKDMARQLKYMEEHCSDLEVTLPSKEEFSKHDLVHFAAEYWDEVRTCL
ncbi:MAG: hypothetical protein L0G06_01640 [Enterobacterales bacterium]|nr:hypothetical protein [Enterobacterales bacterium]